MSTMFGDEPSIKILANWDVSKVRNMHGMFYGATSFNQNIGSTECEQRVTDMGFMFYNATVFKQDIGDWDVAA